MREAIAQAPVGDDVLGDDPTVQALETQVAQILGKEAAVFMPSGTMTNQVALRTHTEPGDEVILEAQSHIYYYEGGGPAALSGVMCRLVDGERGIFRASDLRQALRPPNPHFAKTKLVCLENTHNRGGGKIYPLKEIQEIAHICRDQQLKLHLDGARLWNATAATGISEAEYSAPCDSVSVCFSKGLGAPVGSALAGSGPFIARARRFRKQFGGGMRQAGILAAGALYALEHHRERLKLDHDHAQILATELAQLEEIEIDPNSVETNMILFHTPTISAPDLVKCLEGKGVLILATGDHTYRAVTNLMVDRSQIDQVPQLIQTAIETLN
jgi:threonine aldolase